MSIKSIKKDNTPEHRNFVQNVCYNPDLHKNFATTYKLAHKLYENTTLHKNFVSQFA